MTHDGSKERRRQALTAAADRVNELRQQVCAYLAGEHEPCDCKYPLWERPWTSEMTGCPELRDVVRELRDAAAYENGLST